MFIATLDASQYVTGYRRGTYADFVKQFSVNPPATAYFISSVVFWTPDDVSEFLKNYTSYYVDNMNVLRRDYTKPDV